MVKHKTVSSSNLREVAYDNKKQELLVVFHSGKPYIYFDVPESLFEEFISAPSHGMFLNARIKKQFGFRQLFVDGEQAIRDFVGQNHQYVKRIKIADLIRNDCLVVGF